MITRNMLKNCAFLFMLIVSIPTATLAGGKEVYDKSCAMCHATGVAGAPKMGDKAAWSSRIASGADTLYANAIKGFKGDTGMMPPKGGNTSLSDEDVKAAVDHMVKTSQ